MRRRDERRRFLFSAIPDLVRQVFQAAVAGGNASTE
jgi:hypothetical protein